VAEIVTKSGSERSNNTKYIIWCQLQSDPETAPLQCDTVAFLVAKMSWNTWSISRWLKSSEVVALCCMAVVGVGGNRTVLPVGLTGYHLTINTASGAYSVSSRTQVWLQGELYHRGPQRSGRCLSPHARLRSEAIAMEQDAPILDSHLEYEPVHPFHHVR
jgi:hypothetical protein